MEKQNNKMVRLHPKEKAPEREEYADMERIDFLIQNGLPLNDKKYGKKHFSKRVNGAKNPK